MNYEKWLKAQVFPLIIKLEEKYGSFYFIVNSAEEFEQQCLRILTGRLNSGQFYLRPDEDISKPTVAKEDIKKMAKGMIKDMALKEWLNYEQGLENFQKDLEEYNTIVKAVKEQNAKIAWSILESRSYNEYELIELITPDTDYYDNY